MKIVGIDPGSQIAGFAVIESLVPAPVHPKQYRIADIGAWRFKRGAPHGERIAMLHTAVYELLAEHQPQICVLEKAFGGVNIGSALKLGEARGAVVAAVSRSGAELFQVNPTQAKKTITGKGHADKELVSMSLKLLMGFDRGNLPFDATDALCLALSYSMTVGFGMASTTVARAHREKS